MEVQAAAFLNLSISLPPQKAPPLLFRRGAAFLADPGIKFSVLIFSL
jgi:hypothetical protein